MGGTDHPDNLVELTIAEHADAHWLLWSQHKIEYDRIVAMSLDRMIGKEEVIRRVLSATHLGKVISEETRKKMSDAAKARPRRTLSAEHAKRLLESNIGKKCSEEKKNKISKALQGKTWKLIDGKRTWFDKEE